MTPHYACGCSGERRGLCGRDAHDPVDRQVFGPNEIQVGVQTPTTRKEESQRRKCLELPAEVREGAA